VTVGYRGVHADGASGIDLRVYDGATHALIGALRAGNYPAHICRLSNRAEMLRTGILPGAECTIAKTEQPCRPTEDAGDAATDDASPDGD
jgi:hypothetical protein